MMNQIVAIVANRERYPGFGAELPDRITISPCDPGVVEKILTALDDYLVAGSGCDNFYIREDEP